MNLQEAFDQVSKLSLETHQHLEAVRQAVLTATRNGGKPILLADGRPVHFQAPSLGDLILAVMKAEQAIMEQLRLALTISKESLQHLGGGFVLNDQEANRVAELILSKLKQAEPEQSGHENQHG